MTDGVEVVIVTAIAAAALVALVRPYLRKPRATATPTPACANCAASSVPAARSRSSRPTTHS